MDNTGYDSVPLSPQTFDTIDAAAIDAAETMFAASQYIRYEAVSLIYEVTEGETIKYAYTPYVFGEPHQISGELLSSLVPSEEDGKVVASVHTHIYGEGSSWGDQDVAYARGWAGYVVTPSRRLLRINRKSSYEYEDVTVKKLIRYIPLSNEEKSSLAEQYRQKWTEHKNNCGDDLYLEVDCSSVTWPQEPSWIRILTSSWSW